MKTAPYHPPETEEDRKLPKEYKAVQIETTHGERLIRLEHPTRKTRYFETHEEAVEAAYNDK